MPIQVFGQGAVQTAYVSFISFDLTEGNVVLIWPTSYVDVPYTQNGINYNVLAASMVVTASIEDPPSTITLPDATMSSVGSNFIITNSGDFTFNLLKSDGSILIGGGIPPTENANSYWVQLIDNSTSAGVWQFVQFGAGTSSANANVLAGLGLTALGATLNTNIPVLSLNNTNLPYTVSAANRAQLIVWKGGIGAITLPNITSVPAGF